VGPIGAAAGLKLVEGFRAGEDSGRQSEVIRGILKLGDLGDRGSPDPAWEGCSSPSGSPLTGTNALDI